MLWVLVFGGIAAAGLVMLVCYAVWLAHKAADVLSEVGMVTDRLGELGELVGQIQVPAAGRALGTEGGSPAVVPDLGSE